MAAIGKEQQEAELPLAHVLVFDANAKTECRLINKKSIHFGLDYVPRSRRTFDAISEYVARNNNNHNS